ncbi:MAG: hypothetical protein HF973_03000 [Chloroflexi bacterium]|nr:hypothetical protein [Chloroflexota bacterium]
MNDQFSQLTQYLNAWNGRRRLGDLLLWLPRGILAGVLLAVLAAVMGRVRPLLTNRELALLALVLAALGGLVAIIILLARRHSLAEQARFADAQFQLRERTSTAVEIHDGRIATTSVLARQQLTDTVTAVRQVDAKKQMPLRLNRQDWLVLLLGAALLLAAIFLPNPQESALLEQRALKQSIAEQAAELEALSQQIQENPALTEEQKEEILQPIESAIEGLNNGDLTQTEAVAVLSEAEADLRELAADGSNEALRQQLQTAGEPLASNPNSQTLGQALQNGDLAQAGAAAAQLADTLPSLSVEEQAQLAQDLAETAAALQATDPELAAQLAQAAQALQNGDTAAAQQALREAAATMQQRAQEIAAAQQANAAADSLNQSRQEVAQAGQTGGQQAQNGQGQTGQQGQGEGQGEGQGQGSGSGQPLGQGGGSAEGGEAGGAGGPGPGGGHTENVYAPPLRDLSGEDGVQVELPAECAANPASCGGLLNETPTEFGDETSTVPYEQVFGDYRDAANQALQDEYIPLGLKGYVREYFTSLEPGQ